MSRRKRAEFDLIAVCAKVPDGVAIVDAEGALIGWDESDADAYSLRNGLQLFP